MKLDRQRFIDRWLGSVLCGMLSLAPRPHKATALPRNILVILLSEMESVVLAQPMLARLRQRYPGARIHVLAFKRNREILDIIGPTPPANLITVDDASLAAFMADSLRAVRRLRRIGIDAAIDCELFSRVSALFSRLCGAAVRAGFHPHTQEGLFRGTFINRPVLYNPYHHISEQFLTLAAALETAGRPPAKRPVPEALPPATPARFSIEQTRPMMVRFRNDFPRLSGRPLVLVYPGGGMLPIRAWPAGHYRRLVNGLVDGGYAVGIIGMAADKGIARSIIGSRQDQNLADLTGYTRNIRELLILFEHTALLVTNDGGPGQLAVLTNVPSIVFFGPETPRLYRPLGQRTRVLFAGLSCSPCLSAYNHRNSPCDGDNQCLKRIRPEDALRLALDILDRNERRLP